MAASKFRPCFIIPCYNHTDGLEQMLGRLKNFDHPIIIVDDGSLPEHAIVIDQLTALFSDIILIRHNNNQGKGKAVISGIQKANELRFTHALQIDADGQHQIEDVPKFLTFSEQHPDFLVSGQPIYDHSVPKVRLYGRYITHFWVYIETLSFTIKDSMCGFRVYPVIASQELLTKTALGARMDFDTEIMVRLYWENTPVHFIPTKVIYPKNGVSHFRPLQDNVRISWMHTRLFFGMLIRAPKLLLRQNKQKHWSNISERKGAWGIKLLLNCYRLFGKSILKILLYPVTFFFWLTGYQQRKASRQYLAQLKQYARQNQIILPGKLNTFSHFRHFAESIFDKLAVWMGDIHLEDIIIPNLPLYQEQVDNKQGIVLFCSHLGNVEICRALGQMKTAAIINAIVFTEHAQKFNQILNSINPQSNINLIEVASISPETIISLKEKIDQGEWVAIVGDRTPANRYSREERQRVIWSDFLGKKAPFPQGPFILASTLKCPVFLLFVLKPTQQYQFYFEKFTSELALPRAQRMTHLQTYVDQYAKKLEYYCLKAPLDWFNFYDFWQQNNQTDEAIK